MVVAKMAGVCITNSVAAQTIHHLTSSHLLPLQQQHQPIYHLITIHTSPDPTKAKWVKNLSSRPLAEAQILFLVKDPNFAIVQLYFA